MGLSQKSRCCRHTSAFGLLLPSQQAPILFGTLATTKTIFCHRSPHQSPRVIWVLFWKLDLSIIWLLFLSQIWFGSFSLEILGVKMGLKRLLGFFVFIWFMGMKRLWRWFRVFVVVLKVAGVTVGHRLCWVGGFEVFRREGGVWAMLCWWFWRLPAWGWGLGYARLVFLKVC